MREIDIFQETPRERVITRTDPPSEDFLAMGYDYWDNPDYGAGYGGYRYDGRYAPAAARMALEFNLKPGDSVFEVGCGKGFILVEFARMGLKVAGMEKSPYAREHAHPEVRNFITDHWCEERVDFLLCKEVLPHLDGPLWMLRRLEFFCRRPGNLFLEIQCAETKEGAEKMRAWDPTHRWCKPAAWWRAGLEMVGYEGAYHCKTLF